MSVNSGLKATKIIGQRKALYRQRIPEPSCGRKETVDIDILVTSRNGDSKIMQSIRITSRPPSSKRKCKRREKISFETCLQKSPRKITFKTNLTKEAKFSRS